MSLSSLFSFCLNVVTAKFWTSNWCPQNFKVSAEDTLSIPLPIKSHLQHDLSQRIENCQFSALYDSGNLADRARILSILSVHASSWLQVVPSPRLGFDLAPNEMQWSIKWWLGLPLTPEALRPNILKCSGSPIATSQTTDALWNVLYIKYKKYNEHLKSIL
ncbi:hypothetical protein EMCRGX_G033741 [Ephydatia muelleri]